MDVTGIGFSISSTSIGLLLVAATERGVCHIRFGDDATALESTLRLEFPFAPVARREDALAPWRDAVVRFAEGETRALDVPLDVRGSRFQRRVWAAIGAIPYGRTRSYGALAEAIGRPGAARAVARACATNPVPLAIPCHRVVGSRGALGGYNGGVERKRALLEQETRPAQDLAAAG